MSSGLTASHQDGARQQRPLNRDTDFRVGSYVVHSPLASAHSHRAANSHIPGYQFARSSTRNGPHLPRAIPRSIEMGDRLSVAARAPSETLDGDSWLSSPKTNRYVRQSVANIDKRDNGQPAAPVTPRLPRGVSRIPHQVQQQQQQQDSAADLSRDSQTAEADENPTNKYLTFSKDQATSHFKSLREELKQANSCQANHRPSPVERQRIKVERSQRAAQVERDSEQVVAARQQQPLCEAFIMTGQSMLKLSCSESENTQSKGSRFQKRNQPSSEQSDPLKSASLDRLSDARAKPYLSAHQILSSDDSVCRIEKSTDSTSATDSMSPTRAQLEHSHHHDTHRGQLALNGRNSAGDDAHQTAQASEQSKQTATTTVTDRPAEQKPIEHLHQTLAPVNQSPGANEQVIVVEEEEEEEERKQEVKLPPVETPESVALDGGAVKAECDTTTGSQLEAAEFSSSASDQQDDTENGPTNANCTDRDSAKRLAKRLYNLSGFKRSDVCHHLAKNNPFSKLVADEYLSLFDFRSIKLDAALRKFLSKLQLNGETQERERMLSVFSQRYFDCNRDKFPSAELVQTLVCAMILLNTDLHSGKRGRSKLSLGAFVDGLNSSLARPSVSLSSSALNNGQQQAAYTFPRHLLVDLYESIRKRPLKCSDDKCDMSSFEAELDKIYSQQVGANRSNTLPTRRFAPGSNAPSSTLSANARRHLKQGLDRLNCQQDDQEAAIEFKSGPLSRKRVFEAAGQPTAKGRRSWRRAQVILHDLRLVMRPAPKDDSKQCNGAHNKQLTAKQQAKQRALTLAQDMKNTIKLHHTFAKRSSSYTKRDYVFHLRLADQSEFLVQANSESELNSWIDTINFASACLSSPALPSAVSSAFKQRRRNGASNKRPILPASYTKLTYWEQLIDHEERLQRLKQELDDHLSEAPNTKNATKRDKTEFIEKIAYLKQEIERYTVYVDLMRKKSNSPEAIILSKHPQIASLTPSNEMILSLPTFAPPHSVESSNERKSPKN